MKHVKISSSLKSTEMMMTMMIFRLEQLHLRHRQHNRCCHHQSLSYVRRRRRRKKKKKKNEEEAENRPSKGAQIAGH